MLYPKIQGPCPYKGDLNAVMDGDICRLCQRQVHDISAMTHAEQKEFFASCAEEVCVSYRFPVKQVLAAALAAAALGAPVAALAQDHSAEDMVIVGAIKDPGKVDYVADPRDANLPEVPVVYEDKPAPPAQAPAQPVSESNSRPSAHLHDAVQSQQAG